MTFLVSSVAVMGLGLFDIASTPASVRRYNERQVTVAPTMNVRDRSYGVSVSWSFGRSRLPRPASVGRSMAVRDDGAIPRRSPVTGVLLGLGATGVPIGAGLLEGQNAGAWIFLSGVVIGPSAGQFYAGQTGRALGTIALRAAGSAVAISSLVGCFTD